MADETSVRTVEFVVPDDYAPIQLQPVTITDLTRRVLQREVAADEDLAADDLMTVIRVSQEMASNFVGAMHDRCTDSFLNMVALLLNFATDLYPSCCKDREIVIPAFARTGFEMTRERLDLRGAEGHVCTEAVLTKCTACTDEPCIDHVRL